MTVTKIHLFQLHSDLQGFSSLKQFLRPHIPQEVFLTSTDERSPQAYHLQVQRARHLLLTQNSTTCICYTGYLFDNDFLDLVTT